MRQADVAAATRALLNGVSGGPLTNWQAAALTHLGASGEAIWSMSARNPKHAHRGGGRHGHHAGGDAENILDGNAKKGDVLGTARIAGIMAAKKTHERSRSAIRCC